MRRIEANGLSFMVGAAGTGPKLLFLTGSGADLRKTKTPLNSILADEFQVLSFDQRGMGQSDKPDTPCSIRDYAKDALAILDALDWGKVRLVGYSFGGMVAQELVLGWPERFSRVALVATTAGGAGGSSFPIQDLDVFKPHERARRGLEVVDLSFTPQWQAQNPIEAETRIKARMAAQARFSKEPGHAIGRKRQLEARAKHDTYDRLTNISVPTLVLAGLRDGQAPVAFQKAMAERIPGSIYEEIDGTHQMVWESNTTLRRVAAFMREE